MPFFSTIIPSFNRDQYIAATLESALGQEEQDNEIIVVDDGSTDGTMGVLERYAHRITVITQKNAGPGAARNRGVMAASGTYVAFLDSDDLWFPWTLATFRASIEKYGLPYVVTSGPISFIGAPPTLPARPAFVQQKYFPSFYESPRAWHLPSGTVVRRDLFLARGGFAEAPTEDVDAWIRWGSLPGMASITAPPLFAYRIHPDGICQTKRYRYDGICRIIEIEKAGGYQDDVAHTPARRDYIATNVRATSLYCLARYKFAWAINLYLRSFMWQARIGRIKYLFGFPAVALWYGIRKFCGCPQG
jgi:glycosyltransferase involved in cell wall biosynthesis